MMKLDILAFGVHPDDVELGCAGTLLMEKRAGKKIGVIDLTQGELGTRGSVETRYEEAAAAAIVLGLDVRENLKMRDGFFQNDEAHQLSVIEAIRRYQPEIVLCNAPEDRHPDHGKSAKLVADSCFLSGLQKIATTVDGVPQNAWRPKYVLHYMQDRYLHPNFVFDISAVFQQKMESILAYTTQFYNPGLAEPETYISGKNFIDNVRNRHSQLGKMIGVDYAEGFISEKMMGIDNFNALIQKAT
jgi:N-acetylglucosamine malate deacetylase 1